MRHLIALALIFIVAPLLGSAHVVSGGTAFLLAVGVLLWWIGPVRVLRVVLGVLMIARALDP